jgi:hypothetical protein
MAFRGIGSVNGNRSQLYLVDDVPFSGAAQVSEIYHQYRIELWGEAKSYFTTKKS